jgi:hypothetical protein
MTKHGVISVSTLFLLLFAAANEVTPAGEGGSAVIKGKVVFEGKAPKPKKIKMSADPKCMEIHGDTPALFGTLLVGEAGELQNVLVYVKEGLEDRKFETPTEPVVLDQKGCEYYPHVFGIQVKQPLEIFNSDPTTHNIRSLAKAGSFNIGMPAKEEPWSLSKKFRKAEPNIVAKIKCEIHAWMSAYVAILPHPFFSVSGEDGTFEIAGLPAGDYVIEAWHEKFGTVTQAVTVADGDAKELLLGVKIGEDRKPVFTSQVM